MLDQWIAGQRADHEDARCARFELRRQRGEGEAVVAGELDPASLDKAARRGRTDAGDDPVAADALLAIAGVERDPARLDRLGLGFVADAQLARGVVLGQRLGIGFLGRGETFAHVGRLGIAIEDGDDVALRRVFGKAARVLDSGIARADHHDVFVKDRCGIVELVGHVRQVEAGAAHQVGVALRADRQHDRFGHDRLAIGQLDRIRRGVALDFLCGGRSVARARHDLLDRAGNRLAGAADRLDVGIVIHVHAQFGGARIPLFEDVLALARVEFLVGAQDQL